MDSLIAPVFPDFKVDSEITVEDGRVQFILLYKFTSVCAATIDCSMPVLDCTQPYITNSTGLPFDDVEHDIQAWKAIENTLVTVLDADGVTTVEGAQFKLTSDQIYQLNECLEWYAEVQHEKALEEQDTRIAEMEI
ncbi:hypothetical protein [Acinetobacter wanghuae]|uniref:hypothetical protein n=1 Tax=Acinetobacter wanghuae TaxID=2662362 RepID=UPI003AF5F330